MCYTRFTDEVYLQFSKQNFTHVWWDLYCDFHAGCGVCFYNLQCGALCSRCCFAAWEKSCTQTGTDNSQPTCHMELDRYAHLKFLLAMLHSTVVFLEVQTLWQQRRRQHWWWLGQQWKKLLGLGFIDDVDDGGWCSFGISSGIAASQGPSDPTRWYRIDYSMGSAHGICHFQI